MDTQQRTLSFQAPHIENDMTDTTWITLVRRHQYRSHAAWWWGVYGPPCQMLWRSQCRWCQPDHRSWHCDKGMWTERPMLWIINFDSTSPSNKNLERNDIFWVPSYFIHLNGIQFGLIRELNIKGIKISKIHSVAKITHWMIISFRFQSLSADFWWCKRCILCGWSDWYSWLEFYSAENPRKYGKIVRLKEILR